MDTIIPPTKPQSPLPNDVDPKSTSLINRACNKSAIRLIPILALAFFFNFLDRTSVSFAALTMSNDIGLSSTSYGLGAGLLFAGYFLFEVPSNLILYRVGARRWLARIMITWGLAAAASAFATGPATYYITRIAIGAAEAGFVPGVIFYLSTWFPTTYRTRVLAWFTVAIPLSSVIGGPMSGALLQMDGFIGLSGWQWMFIIEGLPACLVGLLTLRFLVDHPTDAKWLTEAEREALLSALAEPHAGPHPSSTIAALADKRVALLAGITFCFTIGSYGITQWLPQILKAHHLTTLQVGFLSSVPYLCATLGLLAWAKAADRSGKKIANLALACITAGAGLLLSVAFSTLIPAMIGLTIALVGATAARTLFFGLPSTFLTGPAAAAGLALINSIGSLGGFFGPSLMGLLKDYTGSFTSGLIALAAILLLAAALSSASKRLLPNA